MAIINSTIIGGSGGGMEIGDLTPRDMSSDSSFHICDGTTYQQGSTEYEGLFDSPICTKTYTNVRINLEGNVSSLSNLHWEGNVGIATSSQNIYRTTDGRTFSLITTVSDTNSQTSIYKYQGAWYVLYYNGGLYRSIDEGNSFTKYSTPNITSPVRVLNDTIYMAKIVGNYYQLHYTKTADLSTWTIAPRQGTTDFKYLMWDVSRLCWYYVASNSSGRDVIYKTTDLSTFTSLFTFSSSASVNTSLWGICFDGTIYMMGYSGYIAMSTNGGTSFTYPRTSKFSTNRYSWVENYQTTGYRTGVQIINNKVCFPVIRSTTDSNPSIYFCYFTSNGIQTPYLSKEYSGSYPVSYVGIAGNADREIWNDANNDVMSSYTYGQIATLKIPNITINSQSIYIKVK